MGLSRKQRRRSAALSPRDAAYEEYDAGKITETEISRRRAKIAGVECTTVWADDIWEGRDRDYCEEARRSQTKTRRVKVFTGSGILKRRCAGCRRKVPPHGFEEDLCEECRFESGSRFFLENVQGSPHLKLIGGG